MQTSRPAAEPPGEPRPVSTPSPSAARAQGRANRATGETNDDAFISGMIIGRHFANTGHDRPPSPEEPDDDVFLGDKDCGDDGWDGDFGDG